MGMAVEDNEIFVVDDDPAVRDALRVVFELEGYRVSAFPDGLSFLAAARNRTPGCVLLDVHMPGRSGLDILNELGVQYGAPVFMISGQGDIPMAVEAISRARMISSKSRSTRTRCSRGCARRWRLAPTRRPGRPPTRSLRRSKARISLRRGNARFSKRSRSALPTRRQGASLASVPGRSRCIAPASWRSSERAIRLISYVSFIRIPAGRIDRHQECYR